MYKYGQYCPVARAVEIVGDRWTLLIVRDLLTGTHHFNELQRGLPGMSRALLSDRLRRLEVEGVIEKRLKAEGRRTTEYVLTQAGQELHAVIQALLTWGARWSFGEPDPDELDPLLLMWWLRSRVHTDRLPKARVVVEFNFEGAEDGCYWLVLTMDDVSVCVQHPGYVVDVVVTADLASFFQVWLGRLNYADARREHRIKVDALPALVRDFPNWFAWSAAAATVREEMSSRSAKPSLSMKHQGASHETAHHMDPAVDLDRV